MRKSCQTLSATGGLVSIVSALMVNLPKFEKNEVPETTFQTRKSQIGEGQANPGIPSVTLPESTERVIPVELLDCTVIFRKRVAGNMVKAPLKFR